MEFLAQTRVNEFFYFLRGELLTLSTEDDSLDSNNYICVYEILSDIRSSMSICISKHSIN